MAFLSQVTDTKVMVQAHLSPERRKKQMALLTPERAGIIDQGQFESKIRCLEMFDGKLPLEDLRVWTAEQDGSLTIRKATTGEGTTTLEKKKGVYVTALKYHDGFMYSGMSDGYIRIYREIPDLVLNITCEEDKCPINFDGPSNLVGPIKQGSATDLAGFAEGMMITHVNGTRTYSADDVKSLCSGTCALTVKTVNQSGEPDYESFIDVRKHTGAITCLEVVSDSKGVDLIFSGGRDWQIFVWGWNAEKTVFRALDIFPGHHNAVRCLTFHPADDFGRFGLLYTGGDDSTIRCLDINQGKEKISRSNRGFPLAVRGSVRALAVLKEHLFSATDEGVVQVWNSIEGTPIAKLLEGSDGVPSAQLSMLVVNNTVWTGGVDGIIRVWRAMPRENEGWQLCELNEHKGAFINNVAAVAGAANGSVAWHLSEGVVKLFYTESDSASPDMEWDHSSGFTQHEQELVNHIESMRKDMLKNSIELQSQERLCDKLEKIDKDRKLRVIKALGQASTVTLKTRYFQKLLKWLSYYRSIEKRRKLAHAMAANSANFLKIYWSKWARYASILKDNARKKRFAQTLLKNNKNQMQIIYYRKLADYAAEVEREKKKVGLSSILRTNTTKGIMAVYHTKCIRWYFKKRQNAKREALAHTLMATGKKGLMTQYYYKLIDFYRRERNAAKSRAMSAVLLATTDKGLRTTYLKKCVSWLTKQQMNKKRVQTADLLAASSDEYLRRVYKRKAIDWLAKKKAEELAGRIGELDDKIMDLERLLRESRSFTNEMIDTEMMHLQTEMDDLGSTIATLESELDDLNEQNNRLKDDLMTSFALDTTKSKEDQFQDMLVYLKAHGCSCKYDLDTINQGKDMSKKYSEFRKSNVKKDASTPYSPDKIFMTGLTKIRDSLTETMKKCFGADARQPQPDEPWRLPSDIMQRMEADRFHKQCHTGLKLMIIAWDQLVSDPKRPEKLQGQDEAVLNANYLIQIVTRLYGERKRHQMAQVKGTTNEDDEDELEDVVKPAKEARHQAKTATESTTPVRRSPSADRRTPSTRATPPSNRTPASSGGKVPSSAKTKPGGKVAVPGAPPRGAAVSTPAKRRTPTR